MTKPMSPPLRVSPPLPDGWQLKQPSPELVRAEIIRAVNELMWALHRQRTTWAIMEARKAAYTLRGEEFIDNERPWKLATGDVQWWRGEVSSRANTLSALVQFAAYCDARLGGAP